MGFQQVCIWDSIANDIDFVKSKLLENVSVYDVSSINPDDFVWLNSITSHRNYDSNRSIAQSRSRSFNGIIYPADNTSLDMTAFFIYNG